MKLKPKDYKKVKTEHYLKTNNLFFFFNGLNQNSKNWIKTEQELKNINFNYHKVFNKTSTKTFETSIYKNVTPIINSITFFLNPKLTNILLSKKVILNLETFSLLAMKLNNKIYSSEQIKYINSLDYYNNKLMLYQFCLTSTKSYISK